MASSQDTPRISFSFVLAARKGRNGIPLYLGTLLAVLAAVLVLGQIPLGMAMISATAPDGGLPDPALLEDIQSQGFDPEVLGLSPALGLILLVFPFALGAVTLALCMRFLHQRSWKSLIHPFNTLNWRKILVAAGLWLGLSALGEIAAYLISPDIYSWTFDAQKFFPVLVVAILLIPFQSSFEELVFRGYLLQGFSLAAGRTWVGLASTSILFGLMHILNPEVQQFGYSTLLYYIGVGGFLALLTLLDESAELAIGFHAANNIFGATMVSFPSSAFQMPTLFRVETYPLKMMLIIGIIASLLYFVFLARIYGPWDFAKLSLPVPATKVTLQDDMHPSQTED